MLSSENGYLLSRGGNRPTFASAVGELTDTLKGRQDEQRQQKQASARVIAQQFLSLPGDVQRQYYDQLPDEAKQYIINPSGLPAHTPTTAEQLAAARDEDSLNAWKSDPNNHGLAPGGVAAGRFQNVFGAASPAEVTKAGVAKSVYTDPNSAPEMVLRQAAEDKLAVGPNGRPTTTENQRDYAGIKLPEAQSKIGTEKSTQAKNYADAAKLGAETRGINQATSTLPGAGGSGATGDDLLKGLPPAVAAKVKGLADYTINPNTFSTRKGANGDSERSFYVGLAMQYDPTYDQSQYPSRASLRKEFTSGRGASNIRSLNTVVHHLASLDAAAKGLGNQNLQLWNMVGNTARTATGDPRVTNFNMAADAVVNELTNVFKNTGATDQEIKEWRKSISSSESPEQLRGAIQTAVGLLAGRIQALGSQWQAGMGKPKDFKILDNNARAVLKRLGADPDVIDGANVTAGGAGGAGPQVGDTKTFPNGRVGRWDGNGWVDVTPGQ